MDSQIVIAIISAVATVLGAWIANRPKRSEQPVPVAATVPATASVPAAVSVPVPVSSTQIEFGRVLRDVGIVQLLANIGTVIFGFTVGMGGGQVDPSAFLIGIFFIGLLLAVIGFFVAGLLSAPATRWRHLSYVGAGAVVTTLIFNSLLIGIPITGVNVVVALFQTAIAVGAGGGLAGLVRR